MAEHQYAQQPKKTDTITQKQTTPTQTASKMQLPSSHPMAIIQRARINPKSLTHADIMQLQHTIGNRAVGRLLSEIGLIPSTAKPVQRQEIPEEEEPLQGKMADTIQCQEIPEEVEPLQGKFENSGQVTCPSCSVVSSIQKQEIPEEEEPLQTKKENNTGMPDNLKAGVESLSGIDMSNVRVHYNSDKPAEVGALAYTQGTDINVAPGQEKHLPHEAWHVVQQAQGRVQPTMQLKGVGVNSDKELEQEADMMGEKAAQMRVKHQIFDSNTSNNYISISELSSSTSNIIQGLWKSINENTLQWNVSIDGVIWYADSNGNMWFEIEDKRKIKQGKQKDYESLQRLKKTWDEWNRLSVNPLSELQVSELSSVETEGLNTKIQSIALMNSTSGTWYAWGPKEYMEQWVNAASIKEHGLSIKGGAASPQGPGLYLAKDAWRSSVYAKEGAFLLIAKLTNVPTIDMSNGAQMTALGRLGLRFEDLYEARNLGDFLLIYSTTYGRLTTNQGVELTTDLSQVDISIIKSQYSKFAGDAKPVLEAQAKYYNVKID